MDNVTLNGFEVFEELMPGASVKNKPIVSPTNEEEEETKIDLEGVGEELSEEELNNIWEVYTGSKKYIYEKTIIERIFTK